MSSTPAYVPSGLSYSPFSLAAEEKPFMNPQSAHNFEAIAGEEHQEACGLIAQLIQPLNTSVLTKLKHVVRSNENLDDEALVMMILDFLNGLTCSSYSSEMRVLLSMWECKIINTTVFLMTLERFYQDQISEHGAATLEVERVAIAMLAVLPHGFIKVIMDDLTYYVSSSMFFVAACFNPDASVAEDFAGNNYADGVAVCFDMIMRYVTLAGHGGRGVSLTLIHTLGSNITVDATKRLVCESMKLRNPKLVVAELCYNRELASLL